MNPWFYALFLPGKQTRSFWIGILEHTVHLPLECRLAATGNLTAYFTIIHLNITTDKHFAPDSEAKAPLSPNWEAKDDLSSLGLEEISSCSRASISSASCQLKMSSACHTTAFSSICICLPTYHLTFFPKLEMRFCIMAEYQCVSWNPNNWNIADAFDKRHSHHCILTLDPLLMTVSTFPFVIALSQAL